MHLHKPRSLRITSLCRALALPLLLLFCVGCAASDAEIRKAKRAGYQTDFATVYGESLAAVVHLYPHTVENAVTGLIQTAWHPVSAQSGSGRQNDPQASQLSGGNSNSGGIQSISNTAASDQKRFFIRFRVHVLGGKPWRVRVQGEASEWAAGDVPMPLRGAEIPHWLKGRTDALRVAIHRRLTKFSVKVDEEIPEIKSPVLMTEEPQQLGEIPKEAKAVVMGVYRAIESRDMEKLRTAMSDDLQWSLGDAGSADVALALWQADTSVLDALSKVIVSGCVSGDGDITVSCPRAYSSEPNYKGYRAIFEKRNDSWQLTAFLKD